MVTITKELLLYWWRWHFDYSVYQNRLGFEYELERFEKIIDTYGTDKVLELAAVSCFLSDGSPRIIQYAIRTGSVSILFNSIPNISNLSIEAIRKWEQIKKDFVKNLQTKQKIDNEKRN